MRNWWDGGVPVYSYRDSDPKFPWWFVLAVVAVCFGLFFLVSSAHAEYSDDAIADAIYKAEGGAKTSHPYGILAHYKTTTPRQACINTVNHAKRDWDGKGDFLSFLANRYAPVGVANDPTGLNKNWLKNVRYFLGVSQ